MSLQILTGHKIVVCLATLGSPRASEAFIAFGSIHVLVQKFEDVICNLITILLQGEMARIEEMNFRAGYIALERIGPRW